MTLQELGKQYLEQDLVLRRRIARLKRRSDSLSGEALREMEARIRGLYSMARDCRQTGEYLMHYYDGEELYGKDSFV